MKSETKKAISIYVVLIILGVLFYCARFYFPGLPDYPHDDYFHLNRLVGMGNVWSSPVNFNSFAGDGTYVNIYYPWLTMYPMWIFYRVCNSYIMAYKLYYTFLGVATLIVSYWCFRRMIFDEKAAICFAVLYSFSSYRFVNVFLRAALGESIAMTFLPIILMGTYFIFFDNYKKWRSLSIGFALISYSHILSVLMSGAIVVLLFIFSFNWWNHKRERMIALFKAILASLGLSCGAMVPMVQASIQNKVWHPEGSPGTMLVHAYRLADIINDSISNSPTLDGLGFLTVVALAGTIYMLRRNDTVKKECNEELCRVTKLYCIVGIVLIVATSSLLPWGLIAQIPIVQIIQFPWRLNAYSTLFISAASSIMLVLVKERNRLIITVVICMAGLILTCSSVLVLGDYNEENRITEEVVGAMNFETNDYTPEVSTQYKNQHGNTMDKYYCEGEEIITSNSVSENGGTLSITIDDAKEKQLIDIPVYWFSTIRTIVNGNEVPSTMSERGTVSLIVPSDGKTSIEIYHVYSKLTYVSWVLLLMIS